MAQQEYDIAYQAEVERIRQARQSSQTIPTIAQAATPVVPSIDRQARLNAINTDVIAHGTQDEHRQTMLDEIRAGKRVSTTQPLYGQAAEAAEDGGVLSTIKDIGIDVALFAGAGAIAGLAGATGVGLPLATGVLYGAGKYAQGKISGAPEETLTEMVSGEKFSPVASGIAQAAEGALFASPLVGKALKPVAKLIGGASKSTLKGIDYVTSGQLTKLSAKAAPASDWAMHNIIMPPFQVKVPGSTRTLQEIFEPGVARLANSISPKLVNLSRYIRTGETQKRLSMRLAGELGKEMSVMKPSSRYEVLRGFKDPSLATSPEAVGALSRFDDKIMQANLTGLYNQYFRKAIMDNVSKSFVDPLSKQSPDAVKWLLDPLEKGLSANASFREIQKGLSKLIEDPRVTDDYKQFLKDMYSAPARTPKAVAKSSREASIQYMAQKMISDKGLVSKVMKPGYELSTWGRWEGKYIPRDLNLQLNDMAKVEKLATGFGSHLMTMWKAGKTILRPAYHMRNLVSNAILNDMGGLPVYRMDRYITAFKQMKNQSPEWKKFSHAVGHSGTMVESDLNLIGEGLEHGANIFDKIFYGFEKVTKWPGSLQNTEENFFKFTKYLHSIEERGMSRAEAVLDAHKYLLNYGEASIGTAQLRKGVMPFATWFTKIIPLTVETAVKHPLRMAKWLAFGAEVQSQAMESVGLSDNEWEHIQNNMPEYMKRGMYMLMPWRDDKGRLNLFNATFLMPGIGDLNEMYNLINSPSAGGLQIPNPLISLVASFASKKKSSGAPLYYDWEPNGTKWAKMAGYAWDQLSPAVTNDWNKLHEAITEKDGAPTVEQAMLSSIGLKMTPIDPRQLAQKKLAINQIHEQELNAQFHKELRGAKSAKARNEAILKYRKIRTGESFKR